MAQDGAVPLMWQDPLARLRDVARNPGREKLMALVIASILYHHQQPGREPGDILGMFGLRLSRDLSAHPPLEDVMNRRGFKMTIDYSTLFTTIRPDDWPVIQFRQFISLRRIPISTQENLVGEGRVGCEEKEEEEHPVSIQTDQDYREEVERSICEMLLQFNPSFIKEVLFDMRVAKRTYLPLAGKMANLKTMYVLRLTSLPDEQVQSTIAFIQQNQKTFLSKPRLRLELESGWTDHDIDPCAPPMPGETETQRRSRVREALWLFAKPKLQLYEAVGLPSAMQAYRIPGFYSRITEFKIGFERLTEFSADQDRLDSGDVVEAEAMRTFFERCTNLEELNLAVTSPEIFSWAAKKMHQRRQQAGRQSLPTHPTLGQLRKLSLHSMRSFHYLIHAINDAMVAFSDTLQSVVATGYQQINLTTLQSPLWREQKTSLQANHFGDFAYLLPNLTSIKINLKAFPGFRRVGSFSQCPALQSLRIESGKVRYDQRRRQSHPTSIFDPDTDLEFSLFPKWNMPLLKTLVLHGTAALRFDYESLESMVKLEKLVLQSDLWTSMHRHFWRIPRLSAHLASAKLFAEEEDITDVLRDYDFGRDRNTDEVSSSNTTNDFSTSTTANNSGQSDQKNRKWTKTWTLPCLKSLIIGGPQICVFDFSWLDGSPYLEELLLTLEGPPRHLPFIELSPLTSSAITSAATSDVSMFVSDHLLTHIKRLSIVQWVVSLGDIARLLSMVSRSTLVGLNVECIHEKSTLTGMQLVQAIHVMDAQGVSSDCQQQHIELRSSLKYVSTDLTLTTEESKSVGLTPVPGSEAWGLYYGKHEKRIYSMGTGYFVRDEDVISWNDRDE
ncbi:hypothetical protein BGZ58_006640 [Dissophora ornata]|nr:hypothetical protein BGZ58_006640 [Dissophora ornata]